MRLLSACLGLLCFMTACFVEKEKEDPSSIYDDNYINDPIATPINQNNKKNNVAIKPTKNALAHQAALVLELDGDLLLTDADHPVDTTIRAAAASETFPFSYRCLTQATESQSYFLDLKLEKQANIEEQNYNGDDPEATYSARLAIKCAGKVRLAIDQIDPDCSYQLRIAAYSIDNVAMSSGLSEMFAIDPETKPKVVRIPATLEAGVALE